MIETLENIKEAIRRRIDNINFIPYFYSKFKERPYLSEELIKNTLNKYENYLGLQEENIKGVIRYRIGIELSGKYTLVVVMEIDKEHLNIITAWKTNRKWQKAMQK